MIIPIRCFTCNKIIANKWETYQKRVQDGDNIQQIFVDLNIIRYCCKRMFIGHVEIIDKSLKYTDHIEELSEKK